MQQRFNDRHTCVDDTCLQILSAFDAVGLNGERYTVETVKAVASGASVNLVFDPTGVDSDKRIVAVPTQWGTSTESVIMTLGTCTSYTGGTAITPTNRNYFYAITKPPQTIITYNAALTGYSASDTQALIGTEGARFSAGGGRTVEGGLIILDPSLIYVFSISAAPGALNLAAGVGWMEVKKNEELGF